MHHQTTFIKTSIFATAFALVALEGVAAAQGAKKIERKDDGKVDIMVFTDADKLVTAGDGASSMTITAAHHPVRTLLVRPRTHFVPELIESIENL